ncbi:MAG TPA: RecQ family ATP-dependent DNA helicase [Mycobacteriales bacterium]|nr:RecQ family ATP-dependent DNA helicase [Mycobacteriales bacterium]
MDRDSAARATAAHRGLLGGARLRDEQRVSLRELPEHDTLVVVAPAAGKTAIYAIGGELLGGPTVVVSPTLSLQRDQARTLNEGGLAAEVLNSQLSAGRQRQTLERLAAGKLEFLLLAPEQLTRDVVLDELRRVRPTLFVVDEAHCISQWGHDFRPDYLSLAAVIEAIGRPRLLAMTATAAPTVREEIVERLGMRNVHTVVGDTDRPELHLSVRLLHDEQAKWKAVVSEATERDGSGIVYVSTRRHAEQLTGRLRDTAVSAGVYHGALRRQERDATQDAFLRGELRVVVATSAFGMGINKPDVRFVLHGDDPASIDAYHQEAGRAGRDGNPASARLFHRPQDLAVPAFFAGGGDPDPEQLAAVLRAVHEEPLTRSELARRTALSARSLARLVSLLIAVGGLREEAGRRLSTTSDVTRDQAVENAVRHARRRREFEHSRVEMVRRYAETTGCRRRTLLELLGEVRDEPCQRCDNCDAGHGGKRAEQEGDSGPLRPGQRVTHPEFGTGTVQTLEGDSVVVLFDESGYRTLSRRVAVERGLLTPEHTRGK